MEHDLLQECKRIEKRKVAITDTLHARDILFRVDMYILKFFKGEYVEAMDAFLDLLAAKNITSAMLEELWIEALRTSVAVDEHQVQRLINLITNLPISRGVQIVANTDVKVVSFGYTEKRVMDL